ncbi:hypothetical protein N7528_000475 [Penicillium herquei]|nr:hypothetical protein N7528_000475 [Penicillium herquei]
MSTVDGKKRKANIFQKSKVDKNKRTRSKKSKKSDPDAGLSWTGSPWDKTVWGDLDVNELDLDKSYDDEEREAQLKELEDKEESQKRPERQTRWSHAGSTPLTDCSRLPKDWNMNEPDLDADDIESQILRAKERLEDNIMPHAFEWKLQHYQGRQDSIDAKRGRWPAGLPIEVVDRLECLDSIRRALEKGDEFEQLPNVLSIMEAYKSKKIRICGLVTYWSKGVQLCQPRPFSWDECIAINKHHNGTKGFWVEGTRGSRPTLSYVRLTLRGLTGHNCHEYDISIRIPNNDWFATLPFLFDSGSDVMEIFPNDLPLILGPNRPDVMSFGTSIVDQHGGEVHCPSIQVEACLLDGNGKRMTPWTLIECDVYPQNERPGPGPNYRIDGPVFRNLLYCCYVPDGRNSLITATEELGMHLPKSVPQSRRRPNVREFMPLVAPENRRPVEGIPPVDPAAEALRHPGWPSRARGVPENAPPRPAE